MDNKLDMPGFISALSPSYEHAIKYFDQMMCVYKIPYTIDVTLVSAEGDSLVCKVSSSDTDGLKSAVDNMGTSINSYGNSYGVRSEVDSDAVVLTFEKICAPLS